MQKIIIGREYSQVIINLVKNAKQSIKILVYDWRWYKNDIGSSIQQFNNEIIMANRRGVSIFALVNSDFISFPLKNAGINVRKLNTKRIMHIKMIIFDEKYLLIGSHNLTKNAFDLNHEMSILVDDKESIIRCVSFFESLCHF